MRAWTVLYSVGLAIRESNGYVQGMDMFPGYVQKTGFFRHIPTIGSFREHMSGDSDFAYFTSTSRNLLLI